MKKSVAITTIVALHAAVIGMLLIQGCSSEPTEPQAGSAKATGEVVKEIPAEQAEDIAEPKELILPEGSMALRTNPTRPVETLSNSGDVVVPADNAPLETANKNDSAKSDQLNDSIAPMAPKAQEKVPTLTTHTVVKGETLSGIAKKYNVSLSSLLKANGLTLSSVIKIGQKIEIPSATGEVIPAEPKAQEVKNESVQTEETTVYVVKKGDSLSRIAYRNSMTVAQLMSINNLKNHNIKIGQKLHIVKSDKASKPAAASKKPVKAEPLAGEIAHKVSSGETLGAIAIKYGTTVSAIAERNSIADPRKIRAGQIIYVKGKNTSSASSSQAASATTAPANTPASSSSAAAKLNEVPQVPAAAPITVQPETKPAAPAVTPEQPLKIEELKPSAEQPNVESNTENNPPVVEL